MPPASAGNGAALHDRRSSATLYVLPDGEDPDTLVRKEGKEAFEARMEQAMPLSAFLFNSLMPQVDLSTPDGRARLSTLALPLISQVPGETLRIYLRQELGNKLGILDDSQRTINAKAAESGVSRPVPQLKRTTMRILIGLLVQNPELATLVPPLENLDENKLRTWLIQRTGQHLSLSAV